MKEIIKDIEQMRNRAAAEVDKFGKFIQEKEAEIKEFEDIQKVNLDKMRECDKALKLLGGENGKAKKD